MSRQRATAMLAVVGLVVGLSIAGFAPQPVAEVDVAGAQTADDPEVWVPHWEAQGLLPCYVMNRDQFPGSIYRLYRAAFDREPDAFGYKYWVLVYIAGDPPGPPPWPATPLPAIAERFITSNEFQSRYGTLDDAAFVDLLYAYVLGRDPDAGRAYWLAQLANSESRASVVLGFSESPEFRALTADGVPPDFPLYVSVDNCVPYSGITG